MNTSPVVRAARPVSHVTTTAVRASSSQAGPSTLTSSSSRTISPPKKSNGRTLPAFTLRSLISLHHASAGFLHRPSDLPTGFDNAFHKTPSAPAFRGYYDFSSSVQFNQSLHPPGGMENLVEKPKSHEARGMELKGRTVMPASTVQRTFRKAELYWSQGGGAAARDRDRGGRGSGSGRLGGREQFLSDRELKVQEALYGTWERGGSGMDRVEPGLEGVLDYVEAKGKSVKEFAGQWEKRDELALTTHKSAENVM